MKKADFKNLIEGVRELKAARRLAPLSPAEMLREEFFDPMELTPFRLAKDIGVPLTRITAILAGKRAITADTGLRLDRYFGLSESWWLRLQTECDIRANSAAVRTKKRAP